MVQEEQSMLDVLEMKPQRPDWDDLDVSRGGTVDIWVEGCWVWSWQAREQSCGCSERGCEVELVWEKKGCRTLEGQMEAGDWLRKQHKGKTDFYSVFTLGSFTSWICETKHILEMFQLACQVSICWPAVNSAVTHCQLSPRPTSSPSASASKLPSSLRWYLGINHGPNPQTLINLTCSSEPGWALALGWTRCSLWRHHSAYL